MKAKLIVNPSAGIDAAVRHLTDIIERIRRRVGLLDIVTTTGEGDAASAAEDAVRCGYDDERVTYFRASELDLQFARPIKVNTDGQVLETDLCRYRVLPRALRVLRP
jgi:diacylglycerol kinase family enzyme